MNPSASVLPPVPPSETASLADLIDELTNQLQAGEAVDLQTCAAKYPQHASAIRELLPTLQVLGEMSGSAAPRPGPSESAPGTEPHTLGDFRILREVGRGGMGVVYEAEQISLGRRVALKVLPFAATMDLRQLQRFHNEARAAAGLHHTNIVPVFGVGSERGVHYYAMQFIDGRTLAGFIEQQRGAALAQMPTGSDSIEAVASTVRVAAQVTSAPPRDAAYFRRIAEWGIQAAEALDCAHAVGIVHRDVKPANLLVDMAGRLWVTDFGLAQVQSDTRLTMTGDLIGTLRYMSPEQALAKRVVIDHRTDIYSLGATLYELFTLQPAYDGSDRQELLRQIAFEEPKAVTRINKAIPPELETIVLKALEKNPAQRYASAQDMAKDLERFLRNEPIRARRATMVQRLRKWGSRHKPIVTSAAASLLLVLLVAAVSIGWVLRDREVGRTRLAAQVALILDDVDRLERDQKWPEAQTAAERAQAALEGGEADEAVRRQVDEVQRELAFVALLDRIRQERAALVDGKFNHAGAARDYAVAFRDYGVDVEALPVEEAVARLRRKPALAVPIAAALDDWVFTRRTLGDAETRWQPLTALARGLDPDPIRDRLRAAWLRAVTPELQGELLRLAESIDVKAHPPTTITVLFVTLERVGLDDAGLRVLRDGQYAYPADFWLNYDLGGAFFDRKAYADAIRYRTAAVSLRPDSAAAHHTLGSALDHHGKLGEAFAEYRRAIVVDAKYAAPHVNLGVALAEQGKLDEAVAEFRQAIALDAKLAAAHNNLGNALCKQGKVEEAVEECRQAVALDPKTGRWHTTLGNALYEQRKLDEAVAVCRKAIELDAKDAKAHNNLGNALGAQGKLDEAVAEHRKAIEFDAKLAEAHHSLGVALGAQGKLDEAVAEYRQAIALDPKNTKVLVNLGNALHEQGKLDKAVAEWRQAIALDPKNLNAHTNLGGVLREQGKLDEAIACLRKAIAIDPKHALPHYKLGVALHDQGKLDEAIAEWRQAAALDPKDAHPHNSLGQALAERGKLDEAVAECRQAIALDAKLAAAHDNLATALARQGKLDEALAEWRQAIALDPKNPIPHGNLGIALRHQGKLDQAVAEFRNAVALDPKDANLHCYLGRALNEKGRLDEAVAEFRRAIALDPKLAMAHHELGVALARQEKLDEAVTEWRQAIALDPKLAAAHNNLGLAAKAHTVLGNRLHARGKLDEAVAEYRKAIALDPKLAAPHCNLGNVLREQGKLDEAIAECRRAIELKNDFAEAYCNLGLILQAQGCFTDGLAAIERGHELGSARPDLRDRSAKLVQEAEQLVAIDARLPKLLSGEAQPDGAGDSINIARFCQLPCKELNANAARFFARAFADEPKLAENLELQDRYNAACAAALAGCGQGKDAADLTPMERLRWRRQALTWLRADLGAWQQVLTRDPDRSRPIIAKTIQHWLADTDFNGVRAPDALAQLPTEERAAWASLWADVTNLLARAKGPMSKDKEKPDKP
jgi:tetratricopeptide (TPR) repeat protein